MLETPELSALDAMLDPVGRVLTPEVAAKLAALKADPAAQQRVDELADKSTAGQLSEAEAREYDAFIRAIDFIGVLQAKARKVLATPNP